MKILFLHGWHSVVGGVKPTYLKDAGHEVINPALDDDDFDAAVKKAQAEYDQHKPNMIVGSSRGGAVAMNIKSGDTPLVLLCPAWKKWGTVKRLKPNTVILHSRSDDVIPFDDSDELVLKSGLREETLIEVGTDHRLAESEPLSRMLRECEMTTNSAHPISSEIPRCGLCRLVKPLRVSHIVPRFVFAWMRRTGSQFQRQSGTPNVRRQDGPKERLLCEDCEQLFSTREKWFSENVFTPYLDEGCPSFSYDSSLAYFFVSILWRVLLRDLKDLNESHWYRPLVLQAEAEWRQYLLSGDVPANFNDIQTFLTDIGSTDEPQPVVNFNRYMARAVDGTIASSNTRCFVYAKFSRFLVFGAITPFDPLLFVNTKVDFRIGTLIIPQELRDGTIGEFLLDRARTQYQMSVTGMSERQNQIVSEAFARDAQQIISSDLGRAILADYGTEVDPLLLWPAVGESEFCPCGSGKTFRACHGQFD